MSHVACTQSRGCHGEVAQVIWQQEGCFALQNTLELEVKR